MEQAMDLRLEQLVHDVAALTMRVDDQDTEHRTMHDENRGTLRVIQDNVLLQTRSVQQLVDTTSKTDARVVALEHGQFNIRLDMNNLQRVSTQAAREGAVSAIEEKAPSLVSQSDLRRTSARYAGTWGPIAGGSAYLIAETIKGVLAHLHWLGY